MLKKAVIPAAGLGTRLLPITKELPKEMLPLVAMTKTGRICLKPILQAIFEQLYDIGFREFAFIVGRGKRAIEDHFTPDEDFIKYLEKKNKESAAAELKEFYAKISDSNIVFINQPKPKGFGDAVSKAKLFTEKENFLMQAGDDFVISKNNDHIKRAIEIFKKHKPDAMFMVEEVTDPSKYGVITGEEVKPNLFQIKDITEKPEKPPSHMAVVAIYIFKPIIYEAIKEVKPDRNGEIQLTDAIKLLINWNCKVYGLKLEPYEKRIDIGDAESYLEVLKTTIIERGVTYPRPERLLIDDVV